MALADPAALPWVYPYREDSHSSRLKGPAYRPFVPMVLMNGDHCTVEHVGLIDTGADSVLASDLLADQLKVDLDDHDGETTLGIGGRVVTVRYKTIELRLHPIRSHENKKGVFHSLVVFPLVFALKSRLWKQSEQTSKATRVNTWQWTREQGRS